MFWSTTPLTYSANSDTQYNLLNTVESPVNCEGITAQVPETGATNEYLRSLDIPTPSTSHSTSPRPSWRSSASIARVADLESLSSHELDKAVKSETLAATVALLILLATLVLQIIGLAHARTGLAVKGLKAVWCSPFFQPQALVILSGCDVLPVVTSSSQGIACVELDADQQRTWLFMTTFILSLSLVFQLVDSCLLALNDGEQRGCHKAVKLRRPWLTTFGGMIILIILLMKGVEYADRLPNGISEGVIVFRYDPSLNAHSVCKAHLKTPGLRGAIIGYSDGLFSSWGETYLGKNATMNHANR
jgi:energy-coupling factor transporter transmembrane protein EcfT